MGAPSVRRRKVLYVGGYDPGAAAAFYRRFLRQLEIFKSTWSVESSSSELSISGQSLSWSVKTTAHDWSVQTDLELLSWDDLIANEAAGSTLTRFGRSAAVYANLIASGTLSRYFRANPRYFAFSVAPLFQLAALVILSVIAGFAVGAMSPTSFALVAGMAAGFVSFIVLQKWLGNRWRLHQALDDWIMSLDYIHGRREDLKARISQFAESDDEWMIAVRMVSEGVDVPRLCVGVYATSTSTPLYFAQAVGRFVRARRRGEVASVFLPTVTPVLALAAALEVERDHALDRPEQADGEAPLWAEEEGLLAEANRSESVSDDLTGSFEALESDAHFDHVLFDAQQFGLHAEVGSEDEQDYLGLPGLLEPDQVSDLLRERQAKQSSRRPPKASTGPAPVSAHRALAAQRKELNTLVAAYAKKTGTPHANIHMELRRACGGPELATATSEQVAARIEKIRNWFVGRR